MKIVLYGSCSFPYFFREVLRIAQERRLPIEWRALVLSWRHMKIYEGILAPENLYYVHPEINRRMREKFSDVSILKNYPGSIYRDIAADKCMPGQMRRQSKEYQVQNSLAFYRVYKDYLLREKPDLVFLPVVETHDGLILNKVALELGIKTISHANSRNLHLSYISDSPPEDIPKYAFTEPMPAELIERATKYFDEFAAKPSPSVSVDRYEPSEDEVANFGKGKWIFSRPLDIPKAAWNILKDQITEPHAARANPFWFQFHIQLWRFNKVYWRWKGRWQRRIFDIQRVDQLPQRFIYFPLHVIPELSITTYAPYFEDQLRAIDLILLNMPSDCQLAVKEHPLMKGQRPAWFYKELKRRAGVVTVDSDVPGIELVRRSLLTVAITGTAALEALFLGKPSVLYGKNFFSPWVSTIDSFEGFGKTMRDAMSTPASEIRKRAIDLMAHILTVGHDYVLYDPHDAAFEWKYLMNRRNVGIFLDALMDHLRRSKPIDLKATGV